jgi:hypothetical protein
VRRRMSDPLLHYAEGLRLTAQGRSAGEGALLERARAELRQAVSLAPQEARFHAALGWALDWDAATAADAVAAFTRAHQLAPDDPVFETYLLTLLAEQESAELVLPLLQTAAARQHVDLEHLLGELRAVGFPEDPRTLLQNGFLHARNHFASFASEEIERLEEAARPGTRSRRDRLLDRECAERQAELKRRVLPELLPPWPQALISLARRHGIGDDLCRGTVLDRLSATQRRKLIETVALHADSMHEWLDRFDPERMPDEAAAFLYLLLAAEEARAERQSG